MHFEKKTTSMDRLILGKKATVIDLTAKGIERRRLLDLGLAKGTTIEALHKSPSGNPIAYLIMGAVIALRNEDAAKVIIQKLT